MDISFLGATRTVTGSSFLLSVGDRRVMIDCGLYQGLPALEERNYTHPTVDWSEVDAILLTHAHIDHSGLLPRAVKLGYRGPIYSHSATVDLAEVMLMDSADINKQDIDWINRKRMRAGKEQIDPLFDENDVIGTIKMFRDVEYGKQVEIVPGVSATFHDAGHILGSASIAVDCEEGGLKRRVVFSGDVGHHHAPILREPEGFETADAVLIESTYGTRLHESHGDRYSRLKEIVLDAFAHRGKVIIPAFTVGRTQELLYFFSEMVEKGDIPKVPIYLDSPMAIDATTIHENHRECFDDAALERIRKGSNPFKPQTLKYSRTMDESRAINKVAGTAVIIAGSGMCTGGRIVHHLKHHLFSPENYVVFVGYQAEGTLGRILQNKPKHLRILGEQIAVKAQIISIDAFSAHADKNGLMEWLEIFKVKPSVTFMVHGDEKVSEAFASEVHDKLGLFTYVPRLGQSVNLARLDEVAFEKYEFVPSREPKSSDVRDIVAKVAMMGYEFQKLVAEYAKDLTKRIKDAEQAGREPHWKTEDISGILGHLSEAVGEDIDRLDAISETGDI